MTSPGDSTGLGNKFAAKLAGHVVNATIAAKVKSQTVHRGVGATILDDFFRLTGSELANTMGPTFAALATHPATAEQMRPLLHFLSRGSGQMASFIGGSITGSVMSGGIGDLITNLMAPSVHEIIALNPQNILSPTDSAAALARGIDIGQDPTREAAMSGISADRFSALVALNRPRPGPADIIDLLNRGWIDDPAARTLLKQLGYSPEDAGFLLENRLKVPSPADLADAVVRGVNSYADAVKWAAWSGVDADDFKRMVDITGEPPGITDLLFLHRRGKIDTARLHRGIAQSRVKTEWTDAIEALSSQPMSTADAVEAAVQGHLSLAESKTIAEQNGLQPDHWQVLYDTAGNPPGVQEMVSMWHRGVLTEAQLRQGIAESRLKNKYIDVVIQGSETLPPERSVISLLTQGAITDATASRLLFSHGYAPDIVAALLSEGHKTKTQKQRDLTASQVVALYEDSAISNAQATSMLSDLGYDAEMAAWEIVLADARKLATYQKAAISKVRSAYVARRIDENTAATTLDQLHVPPDQRDQLLALWNLERDVSTKELTLAQLESAAKKGIIDQQTFHDKVRGLGYSEQDTAIIEMLVGFKP